MSYPVRINPKGTGILADCHPWWENFVKAKIEPMIDNEDPLKDITEEREKLYREYYFVWDYDYYGSTIIFDSEAHYTWFILRWS